MKRYTQERGEAILLKLDTVYDMLQELDGMPKEVLDLMLKLQVRLENEFDELAYQQGQLED
jgi:hypothetical protein